jgi:hypothetical protein
MLNLKHFLLDLRALYALRRAPNFYEIHNPELLFIILIYFQNLYQPNFTTMFYTPHFSGMYAHPMYFPNQDFYAMYPPNGMDSNQAFYQDSNNNSNGNHHHYKFNKPGYNNRKISQDSGISDFSSVASRKTSNISTVSNVTIDEEPSVEEAKEIETPLEIPTDEMCEEIVQQVPDFFPPVRKVFDKTKCLNFVMFC